MAVLGSSGGGASQSILEEQLFIDSTTWSPWANCEALVTVVGGGGSGSIVPYNVSSYLNSAGTGGGAGAVAKSKLTLSKDVTYTINCGAGGARKTGINGQDGTDGGTSEFQGSDITNMSANGGEGGNQVGGSPHNNFSVTGAAGGAAGSTGNLFNTTGGSAGSITFTMSSAYNAYYNSFATGGGSVGIFGYNGHSSGAITYSGGSITNYKLAGTGGAGVGANSGTWATGTYSYYGEGGPGMKGSAPASNNDGGGSFTLTAVTEPALSGQFFNGHGGFIYSNPWAMTSVLAGNFTGYYAGGFGVGGSASDVDQKNQHAGPFGGGGPLFNVAGGGGDASFGGGGGPYVPHQSNNSGRTSGIGGFGFVLIQVLSWSF